MLSDAEETDELDAAPGLDSSPGKTRRIDTTFQPLSIPSSRNRTSVNFSRVGGSPEDARRSVAVAFTSARSKMKGPSALSV